MHGLKLVNDFDDFTLFYIFFIRQLTKRSLLPCGCKLIQKIADPFSGVECKPNGGNTVPPPA